MKMNSVPSLPTPASTKRISSETLARRSLVQDPICPIPRTVLVLAPAVNSPVTVRPIRTTARVRASGTASPGKATASASTAEAPGAATKNPAPAPRTKREPQLRAAHDVMASWSALNLSSASGEEARQSKRKVQYVVVLSDTATNCHLQTRPFLDVLTTHLLSRCCNMWSLRSFRTGCREGQGYRLSRYPCFPSWFFFHLRRARQPASTCC